MSDHTNSHHPSPDESLDWMRQIQMQMRVVESETGVLRNLWKRAKSSGENIKEMRATIADSRIDPDEAVRNLRDKARYMALRRIPVSAEAIFSWEVAVTPKTESAELIWDVEEAGYRAGRSGAKIDDNPHPAGSEFFVAWRAWWTKGQEAIAREMGPDAKPASTSRQHPGRGPRQSRIPGTEQRMAPPAAQVNGMAAPGLTRRGKKAKAAPKKAASGARRGPGRPRMITGPVIDPTDGTQVY
jgi:hypothetical protein